ncbi:M4 family metallopeptidase [Tenacibaculum finnmarkense]|nr:M4 family metallopeptidase [Tenacibaculum finnmarkense]
MTYGDGSSNGNEGNGYFDALTSIDVAAHEIGHAVCSNTANLAYQRESGAMNEGFSDIWGAAVEHFAKGNGNDLAPDASVWLIGDEIDRRNGSSALRSMSNPNERNQPDTYGGVNWKEPNCGTPTRSNDYCGVHTNSGVLNYWFYLLTVGGSGTNDINNAFNVDAIGMEKSAKISYRLEANYLSANSTFEDARVGSITAAEDLYGANSIEVQSVTNAWHAVGVGQAYVEDCTLVAPSNFNATNINDNGFTVTWSAVSEAVSYTVTINEITSVVTDTSKVITGLVSGTIYNCSVAANCVSGEGGTITSKLITTTGEIPLNYCVSKANNVADEYIQKVVLGTIDNTSTASNGYSDYTSISTSLIKGESNTITITPKWNGTVYSEGYGVWIDYNKDGDFDDAGETVFTKAKSKTTPINGTFTIPESALNGATRMRVVLKYNATPTACETNIQYGEVEDYTVVIESPKSDTTAPTAPSNLSASNITQTSLILNWTAATDNVAVTGYDVYQGATKVASTNTTTATITGLTSETNYAFSVKATDEEANISISSATLNVTTLAIPVSYCESKGTKVSYEWIDYVAFGGMTNTTAANGGYGDFTSKVATVVQGTTNQLVLSAGFASSTYNEYFTVWIDYNKDGDFSDAGEQVTTGNSSSATNRVANIVIPENAKLGKTRMRVSMKYNSASTSCGTFGDGEVEDYTVNIIATSVINTVVTMSVSGENIKTKEASNLSIYPNPAVNFVHVNVASKAKNTSYKIINITGSTVQKGRLNTAKLNVTNLSSGMYILEVYDGQKVLTTKLLKK